MLKTTAWACFLACSWTWCIGMYLPVLLVRDYGLWGWIVFAIPNVIGAAAMGWIIRSRAASEEIILQHAEWLMAFSAITVAFHIFFTAWILVPLIGWWSMAAVLILPIILAGGDATNKRWLVLGVLGTALSLAAGLWFGVDQGFRFPGGEDFFYQSILPLAAASAFGFLLCPYLDGTFHLAVQQTAPHTREPFTLGFGVLFAAMIVFTLLYAVQLSAGSMAPWARRLIALHMVLQTVLTLAFHLRFIRSQRRSRTEIVSATALLVACAVAAVLLRRDSGESIYRLFMSFYALYFPAYVYLRMIPRPRPQWAWFTACAVATPFYYVGFIQRDMMWVLPGVVIVLLARLVAPLPSTGTPGEGQVEGVGAA